MVYSLSSIIDSLQEEGNISKEEIHKYLSLGESYGDGNCLFYSIYQFGNFGKDRSDYKIGIGKVNDTVNLLSKGIRYKICNYLKNFDIVKNYKDDSLEGKIKLALLGEDVEKKDN